MSDDHARGAAHPRALLTYIVLTCVLCGAFVMVIEVLGSRVVGPFYGVSLFVWTSLITVTLVALALGYVAGGFLADRKRDPAWLYGILFLAGLAVLVIPVVKTPVLRAFMPLGVRGGAFASSLVLFGPCLLLLGCVSPYVVAIAARESKGIGRTVGVLYAVSTFGSFLGTVCTGFVLIAYFGVNRIFQVVGVLLLALAVFFFVAFRRRPLFLVGMLFPAALCPRAIPHSMTLPGGTHLTSVYESDSFYGSIRVIDYQRRSGTVRSLHIDGLSQGRMDLDTGLPVSLFAYYMEFLPYAMNPAGKSCLVVGLGAGLVPRWYSERGIVTDVVEIDPKVVEAARNYFGFRTSGEVFIADARLHLNRSTKTYDYVVLDVFNGDTTPGHVLSLEAIQALRQRMSDGGILAINLIGSLKRETFMTASIIETLRQVFETVRIYPVFPPEDEEGWGNLAVIAHDGPPLPFDAAAVQSYPVHPLAERSVRQVMGSTFSFPAATSAIILTDDYDPVDVFDTWLKEQLRRRILNSQDAELLIRAD